MRQVRWKHQKHPIAHRHHDLIRVLGCEFRNRRSDDAGLRSWIVKINRIGSRVRTNVIYAAQEIIRVAMHRVRRTACVDICPATCNLNRVIPQFQELQYGLRRTVNA